METEEKDTSFYIKQALKEVYCSRQLVLVLLLAALSIWGLLTVILILLEIGYLP